MFDASIRQRLDQPLDRVAAVISDRGISANALTAVGFGVGVAACATVVAELWWLALGLWLINRLVDGLDGSVARRTGATRLGGFFDIIADIAIYGGMVAAIGWAIPDARLAALFVFLGYYLNGAAFLAWSSLVAEQAVSDEGTDHEGDQRSLNFPPGLAEGFETIVAMSVVLVVPQFATELLWIWSAIVGISVLQRIVRIVSGLRRADG